MPKLNYPEYDKHRNRFVKLVKIQRICCGVEFTDFDLWNEHQLKHIRHIQDGKITR